MIQYTNTFEHINDWIWFFQDMLLIWIFINIILFIRFFSKWLTAFTEELKKKPLKPLEPLED